MLDEFASAPFLVNATASFGGETRTMIDPALRPVPSGTHVALARRMLLIDTAGELRQTPLVENLQLRVFRHAEPCRTANCGSNDQDFYEFVLSRSGLLASAALGLRAVAPREEGFLTFSSKGPDAFEFRQPRPVATIRPLEMCVACHHEAGLASILSARRLFKSYTLAEAGGPGGDPMPEFWKSRRADWGQLQALWRTEPR